MISRITLLLLLAAVFAVAPAQPVRASEMTLGPITVSVPGKAGPIVISDKATVEKFAPVRGGSWPVLGDHLGGELDTSGLAGPYNVRFSMTLRASSLESRFADLTYEFSYYREEATGDGYVLLFAHAYGDFSVPGTWYPLGWYKAGQAWDELMSQHLPATGGIPLPGGVWGITAGAVLLIALIVGIRLAVRSRGRAVQATPHQA